MTYTPVRQRQWEVARSDSNRSRLYSQNYGPCSAFAGVDRENGWVFLCHFDTFRSVDAIDDLIEELRRLGADFNQFELHTASSYWWPRTWLVSTLVSWFIPGPLFFLVVALAIAFSSTRLYLLVTIWKRKGFGIFPIHHGSFLYSRFRVTADADAREIVAQRYSGKEGNGDFYAPKGSPWKAQKVRMEPPNAKQSVSEAIPKPVFLADLGYDAPELRSSRATANDPNGK